MDELTLLVVILFGGILVALLRGQTHVTVVTAQPEEHGPGGVLVTLVILGIGALFVALILASM